MEEEQSVIAIPQQYLNEVFKVANGEAGYLHMELDVAIQGIECSYDNGTHITGINLEGMKVEARNGKNTFNPREYSHPMPQKTEW